MTIEELEKQAQAGNPEAQYDMALQYCYGGVISKNKKKARDWATKSMIQYIPLAQGGDAQAQFMVGQAYWHGIALVENVNQCAAWILKARDQGNEEAIKFLKERSPDLSWKTWVEGYNLPKAKEDPTEDLVVNIKKTPSDKIGGLIGAIVLCFIGSTIGFFIAIVGIVVGYFAGKWAWKKFVAPHFPVKVQE